MTEIPSYMNYVKYVIHISLIAQNLYLPLIGCPHGIGHHSKASMSLFYDQMRTLLWIKVVEAPYARSHIEALE
jgi:hypothetical protein